MNLPTKQQCIDFAMGLAVQYDEPTEFEGMDLPGEIILTDEMLEKLIEFCQTNQPQLKQSEVKALHIAASVMLTILVMSLAFLAVQPTDKPNTCHPDPDVLRLAWSFGATTTKHEMREWCNSGGEYILGSFNDCWAQDSVEIMQFLGE